MIENPFYLAQELDEANQRGSLDSWNKYTADEQAQLRANRNSIYFNTKYPLKKKGEKAATEEPKGENTIKDPEEINNKVRAKVVHNRANRKENERWNQQSIDDEKPDSSNNSADKPAGDHLKDLHAPLIKGSAITLASGAAKEITKAVAKTFIDLNPETDIEVVEKFCDHNSKERKALVKGIKTIAKGTTEFIKHTGHEWKNGAKGLQKFASGKGNPKERWNALSEHEKKGIKVIGKELTLAIGSLMMTGEVGHIVAEYGLSGSGLKAFGEALATDLVRTTIVASAIKGTYYGLHSLFADENGDAEAQAVIKDLINRAAAIAQSAQFDPNLLIKNMIEVQKQGSSKDRKDDKKFLAKESRKAVRYTDFLNECRTSLIGLYDTRTLKVVYTMPTNVDYYTKLGMKVVKEDTRDELKAAMRDSGLYDYLGSSRDLEIDKILEKMFSNVSITADPNHTELKN